LGFIVSAPHLLVDLLRGCAMSKAVRIGATFSVRFPRYVVVSGAASPVVRLAVIREPHVQTVLLTTAGRPARTQSIPIYHRF
jgi:hypothetical protein